MSIEILSDSTVEFINAGEKKEVPSCRKGRTVNNRYKTILGRSVLTVFVLLGFGTLSCSMVPGMGSTSRILFIGNSYTYANDLPGMFVALAKSGGHSVEAGRAAERGGKLSDYARSSATQDVLNSSKWDFVSLQEQSQIPSIDKFRNELIYPAARILVRQIKAAEATPIFFQTSAHSNGWPENGMSGYESMQSQINYGYSQIAQELAAPIVPVGYAWSEARKQHPHLELWQDGKHPNRQGTYLAACVFFAAIFGESPEGLTYLASLAKGTAQALQVIEADAVLKSPGRWNLP